MSATKPASPLLCTISQIEQTLDVLSPANDRELRLRLKIEEAIELGYEAAYARSIAPTATVLAFPATRFRLPV